MDKKYTTAAATNIERSWREKYGYVPASEQPEIKAKHEMFKRYGRDVTNDEFTATEVYRWFDVPPIEVDEAPADPMLVQRIEKQFGEWV